LENGQTGVLVDADTDALADRSDLAGAIAPHAPAPQRAQRVSGRSWSGDAEAGGRLRHRVADRRRSGNRQVA